MDEAEVRSSSLTWGSVLGWGIGTVGPVTLLYVVNYAFMFFMTDVLRIADLELNRLTQQVRRDGHRIDLTAKEFALFEYLLCSPGRVFSRTMILNHVWDQSFEGVTNIVDVYVRYLRRKVDEPFAVKLIHTVRGVGYCVREAEPERQAALE